MLDISLKIKEFVNSILKDSYIPDNKKAEIAEELYFHLESALEDLLKEGYTLEEAFSKVVAEFGHKEIISKELNIYQIKHVLHQIINTIVNNLFSKGANMKINWYKSYSNNYLFVVYGIMIILGIVEYIVVKPVHPSENWVSNMILSITITFLCISAIHLSIYLKKKQKISIKQ